MIRATSPCAMALAISVRAGSRKATVWSCSVADMVVCSLAPGEAVHETAKNEVARTSRAGNRGCIEISFS